MPTIAEIEAGIQRNFVVRDYRTGLPRSVRRGNRENLAVLFNELGYRVGAEIGVARGVYSEVLHKAIPGLRLICVDPWETVATRGRDYRQLLAMFRDAEQRLVNYDCDFLKMTSEQAVNSVEDGSLDFVFIDGSHTFDATMFDLLFWTKKVKPGGMVAGHDLCMAWVGVPIAVEAYVRSRNVSPWYCTDEQVPTYFWAQKPEYPQQH